MMRALILIVISSSILLSCKYEEIVDTSYPGQKVYLPAALAIARPFASPALPTVYSFNVSAQKMIIHMAVYRSGINSDGSVLVNLALDTDTLATFTTLQADSTTLLPADKIVLPQNVTINSGSDSAPFLVEVDMAYLYQFVKTKTRFTFAIAISSDQRPTSRLLRKAVFRIYPKDFLPVANFAGNPDTENKQKYVFTNTSKNAYRYIWDFGDGASSEEILPRHIYTPGTYTVTLRALSAFGSQEDSVLTKQITIQP